MSAARARGALRAGAHAPARMRPGLAIVLGIAWTATPSCARAPARPSGSGGPATDVPAPVAVVAGSRITKGELCDFLFARSREPWTEAVDQLVDERILALERGRLALGVPPAVLDAAVEAEVAARRKQLAARFGDGVDLEASVRAYYGLDVARWRRDVLRPRLETHLLLERAVRVWSHARERILARVIVSKALDRSRATREKLDRGADFSLLAVQESEDATKATGGVLPPMARGDLAIPSLEEALFAAAPGAVLGPIEVTTPAGTEWHLYKVVERLPAWPGDPATLRERVEADLARSPVTRAEYERWASAARRRHGVSVFAPDGSVLRPEAFGR